MKCTGCKGSGWTRERQTGIIAIARCAACGGRGVVQDLERLEVADPEEEITARYQLPAPPMLRVRVYQEWPDGRPADHARRADTYLRQLAVRPAKPTPRWLATIRAWLTRLWGAA